VTGQDRSAAYPHATVCSGCHACQPERFPNTAATATVMLDARPPLDSVGIVCVCGKALASIEGAARTCVCGRIWLVTAMQIGGPR
jgi:hypothetical protein